MTTPEMIIYWREAAEAAETRVIEQREEIRELQAKLGDFRESHYASAKRISDLLSQNTLLKEKLREHKNNNGEA